MSDKTLHQSIPVLLLILFILGTTTACTVGSDFKSLEIEALPHKNWLASAEEQQFSGSEQPVSNWWKQFNDPELSALIGKLFNSNRALMQARQRVIEVSAQKGVVSAEKRLQLAAALGYTHVETGDEAVSLQGVAAGQTLDVFSTGVVAGWELDLWGRADQLITAAQEDIRSSYADYQGMLVSLAAETALTYINIRTLEAQIKTVQENIELENARLNLTRTRLNAGLGNEIAVLRLERMVESSQARLPELSRQLFTSRNRIKVLLGQTPVAADITMGRLPAVPDLIGIGLPADLLTRRTDIRRALSDYHGAVARVGAARAEQYPTLSLSGSWTLSSDSFDGMFDSAALIYSLGPQLKFPILTGKRIKSTIAVRESQTEQARLALQQIIIEALSEVENSAEAVVRSQQQVDRLYRAEQLAAKSVSLAEELYRSGLTDYSQLLNSEQQLLESQEALLLIRQQALSQVIGLYRSLGGGWEQAQVALSGQEANEEK